MAIMTTGNDDDTWCESEEALKCFATLKASTRSINLEEKEEVFNMLRKWNLLDKYQSQIVYLMPEAYCLLKIISTKPQKDESLAIRLPLILVSTIFMFFYTCADYIDSLEVHQ